MTPADRGGHGILHGRGGDAEPRHDVAARPDVEHRQPLGLLHTDVYSALRPAQDRGDLVRSVVHGIEIVTEDLDRVVATYPGDQLVEQHLDRLDRKSTRLNSSHYCASHMPSSA